MIKFNNAIYTNYGDQAMKAHVVVGANYGDCGKGLITDYLVNREKADVVVRFNGGAQAGHTVQTPAGNRHVFHHFASGTFAGAKTFLAKEFVVNPMMFFKELEELKELGLNYDRDDMIMIDPRAMVSTPWDIMINQIRERDPNASHKGSCGVGFGETIERNQRHVQFGDVMRFTMQDVSNSAFDKTDSGELRFKLDFIRRKWVPLRLTELGIQYTPLMKRQVMDERVFNKFREDLDVFGQVTKLMLPKTLSNYKKKIVFEGAQGLGLDEVEGDFPNITRSRTGIHNVIEFCKETAIDSLDVYYVTRAYLTRHGAGKMESELKEKPYVGIKELTNVTNEFQGKFRYGNLDVDKLADRIRVELRRALNGGINISPKLAVTCVDQLDDMARFSVNGKYRRVNKTDFAKEVAKAVGLPFYVESNGPTRENVSGDELSF